MTYLQDAWSSVSQFGLDTWQSVEVWFSDSQNWAGGLVVLLVLLLSKAFKSD